MKKTTMLFILLFVIFAFLRFWNLHNRIIFDWDQEQFSNQIYDIIVQKKFTLLGPRVTDDSGFFLAPYFTYILTPFYVVTGLNPIALVAFIIALQTTFFITSWVVIKKLFSEKTAILFLALYTFSSFFVKYDAIPWWPILLPLGMVAMWFILHKIYHYSGLLWWVLLGMLSGLLMNMHFQFAFILVFCAVFITALPKKNIRGIIAAFVAFACMFLPLFLFDVRHNFLNTNLFIAYFTKGGVKDFLAWLPVFENTISQAVVPYRHIVVAFSVYILLVVLSFRHSRSEGFTRTFFIATTAMLLLLPFAFSYYGKRPSEYYFLVYIPYFYIIIAHLKRIGTVLVVLFAIVNLYSLYNDKVVATNLGGLRMKQKVVEAMMAKAASKKYSVTFDGPPNTDTGFRYLIKTTTTQIIPSSNLPNIEVRVPPQEGDTIRGKFGISFP